VQILATPFPTQKKQGYPHAGCLSQNPAKRLVKTLGGAHGSLEGEGADVLPALLEEGNEVVDGQHDVANKLLIGHVDVADSDTHAENLLELELDGGLDFGDLGAEVLVVGDGGRELAGCEDGLVRGLRRYSSCMAWAYPWKDRDPRDAGSA
jgi:hypothetical protein